MSNFNITKLVVQRTLRVPLPGDSGTGKADPVVRQLDLALLSAGFKLSAGLFDRMTKLHPTEAGKLSHEVIEAVRELLGDHVRHNVYFKDFPKNVPDTKEFWFECIAIALNDPDARDKVIDGLTTGRLNLLDLPTYGKYQHSYEEMLESHEDLIQSTDMKLRLLHAGGTLAEESHKLYVHLATSRVPLNADDLELLKYLAVVCADDEQPDDFPIRENKAVVNSIRLYAQKPLLIDTPVDALRLAAQVSDGDVTLETPTKFKLKRSERLAIMQALDGLTKAKAADATQYAEQFKRLGEHIHIHEYDTPNAKRVFAVARGSKRSPSLVAQAEEAFKAGDIRKAIDTLKVAPGLLIRNYDRILRTGKAPDVKHLAEASQDVIGKVSGKVLLSLREHLQNRTEPEAGRIFANTKGTAFVTPDERDPLKASDIRKINTMIDDEITKRLPELHLVTDGTLNTVALPLSNKNTSKGYAILPRGSRMPVTDGILRFFMYWKEADRRTDYDLSAQLLSDDFSLSQQVSYTNLRGMGAVHSGDITEAHDGASEFIDIDLAKVSENLLIPQVNIYDGESFAEVAESFFGYMERTEDQKGKPFEPSTVRAKSELRDVGRVALPLVFIREDGKWFAKWAHVFLKGHPRYNQVEANRVSTSLIIKGIVERDYLTVGYLLSLLEKKAKSSTEFTDVDSLNKRKNLTFVGLEAPDNLPDNVEAITLTNLADILPE